MKKVWLGLLAFSCALLIVVAPAVLFVCLLDAGFSLSDAWAAVGNQYGERRNPLSASVLTLAPLALLFIIIAVMQRRKAEVATCTQAAVLGALGIGAVMIWAHFEFWPNFLPGREYPGFPHGLELVIAPLFFAPVAAVGGAILGGIAARS